MAGVWNINNVYNTTNKKVSGKLTFQMGETMAARIISKSEDGKSIVVRTLDGWQFPALLEEPLNYLPEILLRLQVAGYDDGKARLKIVSQGPQEEVSEQQSLADIVKNNNLGSGDEDLLKEMARYSIPLNRDNISRIKSLSNFLQKINENEGEISQFISKYLNSKGIDADSEKGALVKSTLKDFFQEFKNLSLEELLTLEENGIELSKDNIKSFKNIFKEPQGLEKSLKTIEYQIVKQNSVLSDEINMDKTLKDLAEKIQTKSLEVEGQGEQEYNYDGKAEPRKFAVESKEVYKAAVVEGREFKEALGGTIKEKLYNLSDNQKEKSTMSLNNKAIDKLIEKLVDEVELLVVSGEIRDSKEILVKVKEIISQETGIKIPLEQTEIEDLVMPSRSKEEHFSLKNSRGISETSEFVMEEIKSKLEDVKSMIKSIITSKSELGADSWNGIVNNLKANINDAKIFNSISGQYYYMDVPLKLKENDYPCKLIIKDDRKKGKKIDSNNVKMAISITTINLGIIDTYIAVRDRNMKIDFKCDENWTKILEMAKEKLWKTLDNSPYNISISVSKRVKSMDIANCREFFEDSHNSNINVIV